MFHRREAASSEECIGFRKGFASNEKAFCTGGSKDVMKLTVFPWKLKEAGPSWKPKCCWEAEYDGVLKS